MMIVHNPVAECFETLVDGGIASLSYEIRERTMHLLRVELPRKSQGKGIAALLVTAAFEFAAAHSLQAVPSFTRNRSEVAAQSPPALFDGQIRGIVKT